MAAADQEEGGTDVAPRRDGLLVGAGVLLVLGGLALIGPRVFYKTDGPDLLWMYQEARLLEERGMLEAAHLTHTWHVLFLRLLDLLHGVLPWMGLYTLGKTLSVVGIAVTGVLAHRAFAALGLGRHDTLVATLLVVTCPSVVLFGTTVEVHGAFLGAAALATWWMARVARSPSLPGGAVLGILTHLAFTVHGTGIVLPALLLPWLLAVAGRRALPAAAVAGAVHVLAFLVLPWLLPAYYGAYADLADFARIESSVRRPQGLEWLPQILMQEWVWPLLPLSLAWLPALVRPGGRRREALALIVGLVPYLLLCVRQLVFEPEYGAYMLPLILPAARLAVASWWRPALYGMVLLGALLGTVRALVPDDRPAGYDRWEAAFDELGGGEAAHLLVVRHCALRWSLARLQAGDFFYVHRQAELHPEAFHDVERRNIDHYLEEVLRGGRSLYLAEQGWRDLEYGWTEDVFAPGLPARRRAAPRLREYVEDRFRIRPVEAAGIRFLELTRR